MPFHHHRLIPSGLVGVYTPLPSSGYLPAFAPSPCLCSHTCRYFTALPLVPSRRLSCSLLSTVCCLLSNWDKRMLDGGGMA